MTTADPLAGPFMSATRMTDYSNDPGYAIRADNAPVGTDFVADALARLKDVKI